jgi:serine/threonine protein kinase
MSKVGDTINSRWKLVDELSKDTGQGNTFLVVDGQKPDDSTRYVIKLLRVENPKALARFEREIKSCLALQHPNIVKVKDSAYEDTPTPYLVMEYCSGGELSADKIRDLSLLEKLRMFESICGAVSFAHKSPNGAVIHRDIKPGNIFFKDSSSLTPIVGDFGLCFFKEDNKSARDTATREAVGAWEFRPPEADVGRVESCSEYSDVYMLGKLLYWFVSGGDVLVREYHKDEPFDLRKRTKAPMIHYVYELFEKSIVEKPSGRYATANEMVEHVTQLIAFAEHDTPYLDLKLPQHCVFCRVGEYRFELEPSIVEGKFVYRRSQFYGLKFQMDGHDTHVSTYPRILYAICDRCGNVQNFRLDDQLKQCDTWKNLPEPQ